MNASRPSSRGPLQSAILPAVTVALTAAIFATDTLTELDIAAPVLYVAIVLLAVRFCKPRGVILVAVGCLTLTVLSAFLTPTGFKQNGLINTLISLLVITATTYLTLK